MINLKWIIAFFKERRYWILLLVMITLMLIGIGWLDDSVNLKSIIYICVLQWIVILLFLIVTCYKETRFMKQLDEQVELNTLKDQDWASTPFEQQVIAYLNRKLNIQKRSLLKQQDWLDLNQQSLTEFVHNIKSPVTALYLLIEKEEDPSRYQQLMFEWSRIDYMLDQQLFLSRVDQKSRDLYFEHTLLKPLIIEEVQKTRHISMNKGIGFEITVPEDYKVYTDKRWFRMIIRQIISNAVKYSENEAIEIEATNNNEYVSVSIKDKGYGIAKHDLPRIFQRGFTSTDQTNNTAASGIGLYLVDQVRDELGLQIDVQSELHVGTTVTLTFSKPNELIERMSK
ncbi:HAMP domain-containing histidine kinase [Staphylococcus sp. H16/1A]|uniref:histidine kinase n=2 Tax=Staphylococcus canis TaxID=2724942 RepID=A0ABS0T5E5_9STAP|nr:HAMP domain-containing histidine kinase [Staphylococcus canis]